MNQSVQKAFMILDLFITEKELSLQEITEKTKMPKPTAYRILTTLESCGALYKVKETPHDSRYGLGLKLLELGHLVQERFEIREIALPFMEQLAKDLNEVVHLVIKHQNEATYIEKVDSNRVLSLQTKVGRTVPLYIGSGPKMLLAFLPEDERNELLAKADLKTLTNKQIEKKALLDELEEIRKNYYSVSVAEQDADTTGVSFPIFNFDHEIVACIAVSGLSKRFVGKRLEEMIEKGKAVALQISRKLGYKGDF